MSVRSYWISQCLFMNNIFSEVDLVHLFQVLQVLLPLLFLDQVVDLFFLELSELFEGLVVLEEVLIGHLVPISLFLEEPLQIFIHVFLS